MLSKGWTESQEGLSFVSSDDELFIPSEDWHEQFPSIESDLHFDDIVCDNLQDFNPWD